MVRSKVHDRYTATVALLLMAFLVSPVGPLAARPASYLAISGALALSLLSSAIAWTQWKWHSVSSVPTILTSPAWAK